MSDLQDEVSRIIASGALGRSPVYKRLLQYLAVRSGADNVPRELDIATDVFDRESFDPTSDSTVRVYLHNLRQKLDTHYSEAPTTDGRQLTIPKGEYRLSFVSAPETNTGTEIDNKPSQLGMLIPAILIAATILSFFIGRFTASDTETPTDNLANTTLWQPFLDDDIPVTIVVGDYFVFADNDGFGFGGRLIRDFAVNSKNDLDTFIKDDQTLSEKYRDIQLSYLPTGTGAALNDILKVLHAAHKTTRVVPQSQFAAPLLRSNHIIYIGYLSGMQSLGQYAFSDSRLEPGSSYDELIDTTSGEAYQSLAGYIDNDESSYTDFGYITGFAGPAGNQFLFVTGMRDEGLMQMGSILADHNEVNTVLDNPIFSQQSPPAFEVLYRVTGQDRANVSAERLFVSERIKNPFQ